MSAGAKRVASGKALGPKPDAVRDTVHADCLGRVIGARGQKATGSGEQRRDEEFVTAQEYERDPDGHGHGRRRKFSVPSTGLTLSKAVVPGLARGVALSLPMGARSPLKGERCVRDCCGIHVQERPGWYRAVLASER